MTEIPEKLKPYLQPAQHITRAISLVTAIISFWAMTSVFDVPVFHALGYALLIFLVGILIYGFLIGMALYPYISYKTSREQPPVTYETVTIVEFSTDVAARYMDTEFPSWIDVKGNIGGEERVYRLTWDGLVNYDHDLSQYKGQIAIIAYGALYRGDVQNGKSYTGEMSQPEK